MVPVWGDNRLPVIFNGVCPRCSLEAFRKFGKVMKEELIIRLGIETCLAVVTALDDVNG